MLCSGLYVGKEFINDEELNLFMKAYQNEVKQVFTTAYAKRVSSIKCLKKQNIHLKFYEIIYKCKFGPKRASSSIGQRQASTFKRNCEASIHIRISKDKSVYKVINFNDQHRNHLGSEDLYEHIPEVRRLDKNDKLKALNLMNIGCKPARLLEQLRQETNKPVRAKDLLNLLDSSKSKDDNTLEKAVEVLQQEYAANVEILKEDNYFQGLYFSTHEMRENMANFPEILFIDGTYKIFKLKYTLILIIIEDNNGRSKVVAVGILENETRPVLKWLIQKFKEDNLLACEKIKGVMSDKDMDERSVIKEVFPAVSMFICQFHALRTFGREICISKLKINAKERDEALILINRMVKSENEKHFEFYYEKFKKECNTLIVDYFNKNWLPIKTEWVKCFIFAGNLGNLTNNRLESINQKLKSFLNKYNSLVTFIRDFFKWNLHRNLEFSYKDIQNVLKVKISNTESSDFENVKNMYNESLTNYAYNKVKEELDLCGYITLREVSIETCTCTVKHMNELLHVTPYSCTCFERLSMNLPCRHILALRQHLHIDMYEEALCDARWKQKKNENYILKQQNVPEKICTIDTIKKGKKLTIGDKKRIVKIVTDDICNTLLIQPQEKFYERINTLKKLNSKWKKNEVFYIDTSESESDDLEETIHESTVSLKNIRLSSPPKIIGKVSGVLSCNIKTKKKRCNRLKK